MPAGFTVERIQKWVKTQIKHKLSEDIKYNICLVSDKQATGMQKVMDILEKIKRDYPEG